MIPNKVTGASAGEPRQLPERRWAVRAAQLWRINQYLGPPAILWIMVVYALVTQLRSSRSWWRTIFVAACAGAWTVYAFHRRRREQAELAALDDWYRRLQAAIDVRDFDDDGHFHEYFEPADRERLIQELESMPRGSRSLRRAVEIVNPEVVDDDA